MKRIKQLYRATYQGETVVTDLVHKDAKWHMAQEWIPNAVTNTQISNKACVIGNGISRKDFPLHAVINHFGGLLARTKLQTYGCNALYRDQAPDFLVVTGEHNEIIKEVAESGYCNNNIVYASAAHIQEFPGQFYLIPQDPSWNSGAIASMMAAFDGHTTVYLLGFDGQDTVNYSYNMYAGTSGYQAAENATAEPAFLDATMKMVFDVYNEVDFVRVMPSEHYTIPEAWRYCPNLRQISYRQFIYEADL
jgi:hypothetical protein